jgi:hypothetical protein
MTRKRFWLVFWTLGLLLQTSPAQLRALDPASASLTPAQLSAGTLPVQPPPEADFNHDGIPETLALTSDRLTISSGGKTVWQSPAAWTVAQAEITDLNADDDPEATLLVWRAFRPWPVDKWLPFGGRIANFHDADGNSCHMILIGWRGSEYGELWAGSALADPVTAFAAADLNGDQAQELVTLEGSYAGSGSRFEATPAQALKVWEWNGFGFTVISGIKGTFTGMALVQEMNGHILILVP